MSVAASRRTAKLWFDRADECAQELPIDLRCYRIDIDVLGVEKVTGVFDPIDPRWLNINLLESGRCEFRSVLVLFHRSSDAADTQQDVLANLRQNLTTGDDIRDSESASGLQNSERFTKDSIFVSGEIDDAV